MSIANPQLPAVSCRRGAPMGRRESTEGADRPARCFRLRFIDGCYDEGGAYWGSPANVYCATNGHGLMLFCRADSRKEAKRKFRGRCGSLRWVN